MENRTQCYLCRAPVDPRVDRDHVPPRGFFPVPKPNDLITVPCCRSCNQSWSKDDEAIRAIFAGAMAASPAGQRIMTDKVIRGTVARSPAFREQLLSQIREIEIILGGEPHILPAMTVPDDRVNPFVVRVAKGILAFFHPQVDYHSHDFHVRPIVPDQSTLAKLAPILQHSQYDRRGDEVFQVLHCITDTARGGFCLQGYYGAVWYLVFHTDGAAQHPGGH
jgi:hypothetical protein